MQNNYATKPGSTLPVSTAQSRIWVLFLWLLLCLMASSFAVLGQTVSSDKDDYAPGEIATITGSGWNPGETVFVEFKEEPDYPDYHRYYPVADEDGNWVIKYDIETRHLGVKFTVTAIGQQSGLRATTVFTDGVYTSKINSPTQALPKILSFSSTSTSTVLVDFTFQATKNVQVEATVNIKSGNSIIATNKNIYGSSTFNVVTSTNLTASNSGTISVTIPANIIAGNYDVELVVYQKDPNAAKDSPSSTETLTKLEQRAVIIQPAQAATSLTVQAASGTYGGTATLTATLTSGGNSVSGKSISFTLNGNSVGSANTNASGVATLNNISLAGINAGTYGTAVGASFTADATHAASSGANSLTVIAKQLTPSVSVADRDYDGGTSATISSRSFVSGGVVGTDDVTLIGGSAAFVDVNAGSGKTVNINGLSLGGTKATNYSLSSTSATTTATIRSINATLNIAGYTGAYDGKEYKATGTATGLNALDLSSLLTFGAGQTNAPGGKASWSFAGNNNYNPASGEVDINITTRPVEITAEAKSKTYGDSDPELTYKVTSGSLVNGDAFTGALSRTAGEDVKTYAINQGSLTISKNGNSVVNNYDLTFVSANLTITARPITVTPNANQNKVYGTADPAFAYSPSEALLAGNSFSGALAREAGEDARKYTYTLGSLSAGDNYTVTLALTVNKFEITPKAVVVTPDALSKVYGATDPAFTFTNNGDLADAAFSGALARAVGETVGSGPYAYDLGTLSAGTNYSLSLGGNNKFAIAPKSVTATLANPGKVYDGTTAAPTTTATLSGVIGEDDVIASVSNAAFDNAAAGSRTVTATVALSGAVAGNYSLASTTASITANITARPITVTPDANQKKTYGEPDPIFTYTSSEDLINGNSFSGILGRAEGENVGEYAYNVGTLKAGTNYTVTLAATENKFEIIAKQVVVTPDAGQKKVYGTTDPSFKFTNNGELADDAFSGDLGRAAGEDVDTYNYTIGSLSAGNNYSLTVGGSNTFAITPKELTGSFTAENKVYDGNTSATVLTRDVNGKVGDDKVNLSGGTATFSDKNVANGKTVTLTGATLAGDDAANYSLSSAAITTTAAITALQLTPNITANNKPYDGNTSATLSAQSVNGQLGEEVVTLIVGSASFNNKNIGSRTVTAGNLSLGGADAANYVLAVGATATDQAEITAVQLTPVIVANNKFYDGNTSATLSSQTVSGMVNDETAVNLVVGSVSFNDKNVGIRKATASNLSLSGDAAGNYVLAANAIAEDDAEIKKLGLVGSFTAADKDYDGTTTATVTAYSVATKIDNEEVNITGGTATFDNKNQGNGKTITLTGATLTGADKDNYNLTFVNTATANINKKALTATSTIAPKVYNGSAATGTVILGTVSGLVGTETLIITPSATNYADANVGTGKTTTINYTLADGSNGGFAANYSMASKTDAIGDITPRPLVVKATGVNKIYDGTTSAEVILASDKLANDDVTLSYTSASFNNPNVANDIPVIVSGISISGGADKDNYSLSNTTASTTANITIATTTTTLITSAVSVRYMDNLTMTAQIKPLNMGSALTGTVEFKIGNVSYGSATVVPIPGNLEGLVQATLIKQVSNLPGNYTVSAIYTSTNSNYSGNSASKSLEVRQRSADPFSATGYYTGEVYAWTTGANSSKGTLTLTATIKDNIVPRGDVRSAKVTFYYVNGTTLTPIPSAKDLPVGLVDINDGSIGFASAIVQFDIGTQNAQNYQIAVGISGAYTNNPMNALSQAILTVSKPVTGGYIVGGSQIKNLPGTQQVNASAGYIKGHPGLNTDYQFDIQYTKSGTNPKGKVKVLVRSYYKVDGTLDSKLHTYIITTNAIATMNVAPASGGGSTGTFSAKANLDEQLENSTIVPIEGGITFQMVAFQNNCTQQVAITLFRKAGGIWFSSNWDGSKTQLQAVNTGSTVYVSGGGTCTTTSITKSTARTSAEEAAPAQSLESAVTIFPNPFEDRVTVDFGKVITEDVVVTVMDTKGAVIFQKNFKAGSAAQVEVNLSGLNSGVYYLQSVHGKDRKNTKIVKY